MLDALLEMLAGRRTDDIVWTADITYWIAGQKQAGTADPCWDTEEGYLALHRDLGLLPYYYYERFWAAEPRYAGGVELVESVEGDTTLRRFRTPIGELVEQSVYSPSSCSAGCTKHFVQSPGDLDVLLYVLEHRRLEPANLTDYAQRRRLWAAYDGLPCLGMPRSPLPALCYEWAGVEHTAYLLADCEDKVSAILDVMESQETPVLEAICELAPPLVHFPDNLSSANLTSFYDRYLAGTHRRRIERLHAAGVRCAVHLDGTVKGLLPKLIGAGFDAIEALTPRPGGDLSVEEIRALAGDADVILWGGVPGVMFAPPFTWQEVESQVQRVIDCWGRGRFILGVADQVPPDGNLDFCRKIADAVGARRKAESGGRKAESGKGA